MHPNKGKRVSLSPTHGLMQETNLFGNVFPYHAQSDASDIILSTYSNSSVSGCIRIIGKRVSQPPTLNHAQYDVIGKVVTLERSYFAHALSMKHLIYSKDFRSIRSS